MKKFICVTPIYLNPHTNKYEKSDGDVEINIDAIEMIYHPSIKNKMDYYTIYLKGRSYQEGIKTYDRFKFIIEVRK